jgi:dual specificity tyrosine-phosphorylation-regulated kinase 2/3/4
LKGCDDPLFLDFIKRCLEWDPSVRMTASQALRHSWLRRKLPKPPSENPPMSRRTSAYYRNANNNGVTKLGQGASGQSNNSSNDNKNSNSNNNILNNTSNQLSNRTISDPDMNKHTKLPKINGN